MKLGIMKPTPFIANLFFLLILTSCVDSFYKIYIFYGGDSKEEGEFVNFMPIYVVNHIPTINNEKMFHQDYFAYKTPAIGSIEPWIWENDWNLLNSEDIKKITYHVYPKGSVFKIKQSFFKAESILHAFFKGRLTDRKSYYATLESHDGIKFEIEDHYLKNYFSPKKQFSKNRLKKNLAEGFEYSSMPIDKSNLIVDLDKSPLHEIGFCVRKIRWEEDKMTIAYSVGDLYKKENDLRVQNTKLINDYLKIVHPGSEAIFFYLKKAGIYGKMDYCYKLKPIQDSLTLMIKLYVKLGIDQIFTIERFCAQQEIKCEKD